jgi:high-affinity Fe2+/Pb2+ permease
LKKLAIFGCYSIAAVYALVGVMAILSFMGLPEDAADEERIINILMDFPFGEVVVILIIAGLAGYVLWRFYEAFTDHYNYGSGFSALARRTGIASSALGYVIIAWAALQVLINGQSNGEEDQQQLIARVFEFPAGQWLVGLAGTVLGFAGLIQIKYVASGEYKQRIDLDSMSHRLQTITKILAWTGYLARTVILLVLGYFLLSAAIHLNPEEAGDTDTAFDFLGSFGTVGHIMFNVVAVGTISYGIFMVLHGYYYSFEEEQN